eukprot:3105866-Pleurochrysis_carterae.AAC.1
MTSDGELKREPVHSITKGKEEHKRERGRRERESAGCVRERESAREGEGEGKRESHSMRARESKKAAVNEGGRARIEQQRTGRTVCSQVARFSSFHAAMSLTTCTHVQIMPSGMRKL